jgi:hypothetical protein
VAQGQVVIAERTDNHCRLARGTGDLDQQDAQRTEMARARLDALLAETGAYRSYVQSAPVEAVVR